MATGRNPYSLPAPGGQSKLYMLNKYNRLKAEELEKLISDHVCCDEVVEEEEGEGVRVHIPHVRDITRYTMVLPIFLSQTLEKDIQMRKFLVDDFIQQNMESQQILNWCKDTIPLYPIRTIGDGNCLMHSASIAMWAVHDRKLQLRQLLHIAMTMDQGELKTRWRKAQTQQNHGLLLQSMELTQDWDHMVALASSDRLPELNALPYHSLEDIHIFVLAQIIRRPIVVLSDAFMRNMRGSVLAPNHAPGIYLPFLWPPEVCVRAPLVLAYFMNHFSPLIPRKGDELLVNAVPLVNKDSEALSVHYITDEEESQVYAKLEMYLDLIEVPVLSNPSQPPILAARLHRDTMPSNLNLMLDFEAKFEEMWHQRGACQVAGFQGKSEGGGAVHRSAAASAVEPKSGAQTCITPGCTFYGTKENKGRCTSCFKAFADLAGKEICPVDNCVNTMSDKPHYQPYCNFHHYMKKQDASHPPPPQPQPPRKAHTDAIGTPQSRGKDMALPPPGSNHGNNAPKAPQQPRPRPVTAPLPPPDVLATVSPLCRVPGCNLKSKAEYDHLCTQHYALHQAKVLAENVKPVLLPMCVSCNVKEGVSHFKGRCGDCYTRESLERLKVKAAEPKPPPGAVCVTDGCLECGMEEKEGYCLDCYNTRLALRMEASAKDENPQTEIEEETEEKIPFEAETSSDVRPQPRSPAPTTETLVSSGPRERHDQPTSPSAIARKTEKPQAVAETREEPQGPPVESTWKPTTATKTTATKPRPPSTTTTEETATKEATVVASETTIPQPKKDITVEKRRQTEEHKVAQTSQTEEHKVAQTSQTEENTVEQTSQTEVHTVAQTSQTEESKPRKTSQTEERQSTGSHFKEPTSAQKVTEEAPDQYERGENTNFYLSEDDPPSNGYASTLSSAMSSDVLISEGHSLPKEPVITKQTSTTSISSCMVQDVKCAYDRCTNRVKEPGMKLCEDCHAILTKHREKRKARNSAVQNFSACASGCGKAGNSQQQGYCNSCYRKQLNDPASHVHRSSESTPKNIHITMGGSGTVMIGGSGLTTSGGGTKTSRQKPVSVKK